MTDESKHSIRIGEYKLFGLASHLVITGHDETGAQIWELNGLATDRNGRAKSIGMPWNSRDTIKGYLTFYPVMGDKVVNQTTIVIGTPEEIESFKGRARKVMEGVNARDLDYKVDIQNSNSFAGTILRSFGIQPQQLLNSPKHEFVKPVPGFTSNLLGDTDGLIRPGEKVTNPARDGVENPGPGRAPGQAPPLRRTPDAPDTQGETPFDQRPSGKTDKTQPSSDASHALDAGPSGGEVTADPRRGTKSVSSLRTGARTANPFDLKRPNLKMQAELLETSPVLAKRLIAAAGRNPALFRL